MLRGVNFECGKCNYDRMTHGSIENSNTFCDISFLVFQRRGTRKNISKRVVENARI
jgi:hypothetical protein